MLNLHSVPNNYPKVGEVDLKDIFSSKISASNSPAKKLRINEVTTLGISADIHNFISLKSNPQESSLATTIQINV